MPTTKKIQCRICKKWFVFSLEMGGWLTQNGEFIACTQCFDNLRNEWWVTLAGREVDD